jgi:hypothetical protein
MSGRDDEKHGGYPIGNPFRRRREDGDDPVSGPNETPVDLAAVQADDALLDLLAAGHRGSADADADAELARVLVAWRLDVEAEAIGELVDTDTAIGMISAARKPVPRRHPVLGPAAAAAAVLVIAFSGVGLVAKSAQPGDQLFSLTKVLYADYARSAEAAQKAETELNQAQTALQQGQPQQAEQSLQEAKEQLTVVDPAEGQATLAAKHEHLQEVLAGMQNPIPASVSPTPTPVPSSPPVVVPPPVSATHSVTPSVPPRPSVTPTTTTPAVPASTMSGPPTSRTTLGTTLGSPGTGSPTQQSVAPPPQSPTS